MIKIICVGKIKEKYYADAIKEYSKRLSRYTNLEIIELPDYNFDIEKTKIEEGRNILLKIKSDDYAVALDINGKEISSPDLSHFISDNISKNIVFIIGGSYGLSNEVKERANYLMSFSKLTFPHQLFRVMLLEQVYRAFKIMNNESYHK